ncbi:MULTISPECIES: hypothetical protein, partial [unclassified Gilliamella]|uniref:hypothetical protein n=1 Tax=unclassified Gilliamella TaxID=2685620 RepID=UPI002269E1D4
LKGCVYYATPFYSSRSFFKKFDLVHQLHHRLLSLTPCQWMRIIGTSFFLASEKQQFINRSNKL